MKSDEDRLDRDTGGEDDMGVVHDSDCRAGSWLIRWAPLIIYFISAVIFASVFYATAGEHMKNVEKHVPLSRLQRDFVPRSELEKDMRNLNEKIDLEFDHVNESLQRIEKVLRSSP